MRNEIVKDLLDKYERMSMGKNIHEDFENLMDELKQELNKSEANITKENDIDINVLMKVPSDFSDRDDFKEIINEIIDDGEWSWTLAPTRTLAVELERIFLSKGCSSLVSFIEGARYVERKFGLWRD